MNAVASIADIRAIEAAGLPADLPPSTYAMIARGAAIDPAAPALSFFARAAAHRDCTTWNYAQLLDCITRAGNLFHALGVGPGDVVAYVLPNLPETHFTVWGAQTAGIVAAINPLLEPAAIAELAKSVEAKVLVTLGPAPGDDIWARIAPILPRLGALRHVVLVDPVVRLRPDGTSGRATAADALPPEVRAAVPDGIGVHDFAHGLQRQPGDRLRSERVIDPNDRSSFFGTGGTTGAPKIAMRRHGNEVANAWSVARVMGGYVGPGTTLFCGLPMFHVNAVLVTGLLAFATGAHVLLGTAAGFRGEAVLGRFWEIVAHHRVNFFSAVPTVYAALLQVPIGDHDISSLQFGLCGAAPMPVEVFDTFQQRTGLRILEGYGLTEATCVSSMNPPAGERRVGSIGLRLPGQDMKAVVLDDTGGVVRDCAVDEVGTIVVAGPSVFAGYRLAEHNRGLWLDLGDGRRWLNTGDLGRCDTAGYFWLTGRRKELIIRGGHNIDPATIEEPMHRHPAVQLAAAIGRPDAHAGELPVLYVQLRAGAAATEAELLDYAKTNIAERAAHPKAVRVVAEMPLTGVGKIFKPALRHREIREVVAGTLEESGVAVQGVDVREDRSRGTIVQLALKEVAQEPRARAVLGRFAFTIETAGGRL